MSSGGKGGAKAPDPYATAQAQLGMNTDTARLQATLNRGNTVTPYGTITQQAGSAPWDEQGYLAANPDVAQWVSQGNGSGQDHYSRYGMNEGRQGVAQGYDPNRRDQWTTTFELSPEQTQIYDQGVQLDTQTDQLALDQIPRLQKMLSQEVQTSDLPAWQNNIAGAGQGIRATVDGAGQGIQNSIAGAGEGIASSYAPADGFSADRLRVEQAMFDRINPQLDRSRQQLESRLISQGFTPGTEAYRAAADEANRAANDARLGIIAQGGTEQSRLLGEARNAGTFQNDAQAQGFGQRATNAQFGNAAQAQGWGQNLDAASFQNTAQQQLFGQNAANATFGNNARSGQLAERLQLRAQPINEIAALVGLGPGMQMPQQAQMQPVNVGGVDYAGMINNQYQQQLARQGSNLGAFAGLGGAALGSIFGGGAGTAGGASLGNRIGNWAAGQLGI
jgi:hypothetical protein